MNDSDQITNFSLLKEDPELQYQLIDEYVQVDTIKNCTYIGFLHSIDPGTHSIILSVPQEDKYQTIIIPGHAILDIAKKQLYDNVKPPQRKPLQIKSKEELVKRRNKLKAWFELNLLPVTELEDKLIIGSVSLLLPYSTSDLYTENPIVALQIKKIMDKMPDDFCVS